MVWARLDDAILDNPKIARVGVYGFALHVAAITWCCRNLTDGHIPYSRVTALVTLDKVHIDDANPLALPSGANSAGGRVGLDPHVVADALVAVGLWRRTDDGYELHDFLDYNPSREEVEGKRLKANTRQQRRRSRGTSRGTSRRDNDVTSQHPEPEPDPDPVTEGGSPPTPHTLTARQKPGERRFDQSFASPYPEDFEPGPESQKAADRRGFKPGEVDEHRERFRLWAKANAKQVPDWDARFAQWLLDQHERGAASTDHQAEYEADHRKASKERASSGTQELPLWFLEKWPKPPEKGGRPRSAHAVREDEPPGLAEHRATKTAARAVKRRENVSGPRRL